MASDAARDRLLGWYRRYIGEPDADSDVYLGFGLFFGGIGFGLLGLVLFLWSAAIPAGTLADPNMVHWTLREVAFTLGMVGLPALMVSIVVLLPVEDRVRYVAGGGTAVALVAVAAFVVTYPFAFNVQATTTAAVVAVYAVGLVAVIGATGAALVAHHLDRAEPAAGEGADEDGVDEAATEEQVERDIEAVMDDADLTWGGVKTEETRRLSINPDEEDVDLSGAEGIEATTTRSSGTDDAVAGLKRLRGGEKEEARGSDTSDQAAALRELRESQRHEDERKRHSGLLARLKAFLGRD
jgi:hypothetical protein